MKGKQVKLLHTFSLDVLLERNMDEVIAYLVGSRRYLERKLIEVIAY